MPFLPFAPPPFETSLLELLAPRVTDDGLLWIAEADAGFGAEIVEPVLRTIRDDRRVPPGAPAWETKECLELVTNHTWDDMDRDDHALRLFACAALFTYRSRGGEEVFSHAGTMARMVESARAVGRETIEPCAAFVSWLAENDPPERPRAFHGLAILLLQASEDPARVTPAACDALRAQVEADRRTFADDLRISYGGAPSPWLLGLDDEQKQFALWRTLVGSVAGALARDHPLQEIRRALDTSV